MNVDGYVSSGGLGGPAILPLSLAKMAQLTQAFPDKAFSGIGGIAEFAHALNYFLLGCGTVQVCTAAMLDHAIGPNVHQAADRGHGSGDGAARLDDRSRTSAASAAIASSRTRRSAGRTPRRITAATSARATPPPTRTAAAGRAPRDARRGAAAGLRRAHRGRLGEPALESRPRADAGVAAAPGPPITSPRSGSA